MSFKRLMRADTAEKVEEASSRTVENHFKIA